MLEPTTVTFSIETEVAPASYEELLKYMYQKYLQPMSHRFANVKQSIGEGVYALDFTFLEPEGKWHVDVDMKIGKPIKVTMTPSSLDVSTSVLDQLKEDLIIIVQFFEESVRRSTLYFTFVEGKEVVPEKTRLGRARVFQRIFFGNILFLFVLLIGISIFLFLIIGPWAVVLIVVSQFLTVLFADKIIGTMGDWPITSQNPKVDILQYHLSAKERETFTQKSSREKLLQMKKEIYDKTIALGRPIECDATSEVMSKYGLECSPGNMAVKTFNVYDLVQKTTEKYGQPVPKIALSNTMVANAAATGPSPKHGLVLITTGLLVQLDEEEILSVLGHEVSHLHARDPFVLFGLTSGEYLFQYFVLLPYVQDFALIYLLIILGATYFVAKFFEARADLDSALKTGKPKVLATALRKIGFRRLQYERSPSYKIQDWITWDPHPPTYFRVERLEKLEPTKVVKHTFVQSAKDCIRGFFAAF